MAQSGPSLSEALKMLQEFPSDSESENVESSDTDEYVPDPLEESDNVLEEVHDDDVLDEIDDLSQPGSSTQQQIHT